MIRITGPRFDADSDEVIGRLKRHLAQRRRELSAISSRYLRPRSSSQSDSG
jgi:hypothetical protein